MHHVRVAPVMPNNVDGDPFAKVSFYSVDALFQERANLVLIPRFCGWVGEVNERHARLPHVPLPNRAVGSLHEIIVRSEERRVGKERNRGQELTRAYKISKETQK